MWIEDKSSGLAGPARIGWVEVKNRGKKLILNFKAQERCQRRLDRLPFPTRLEGSPFHRGASLLHCPYQGWPDWSPTAHDLLTRPPTGTPRRASNPGEGLPRPRVARAQETNGLPLPSS